MRNIRRNFFAACLMAMAFCVVACSASKVSTVQKTKKTCKVEYFSKIESTAIVDIVYTQGNSTSARIEGNKQLVDRVVLKNVGSKLVVGLKGNNISFSGDMDVKVYVSSPDLTDVTLRGSGDFETNSNIDTDNLMLYLAGSGDAKLRNVICDKFNCRIDGSGDMEAQNIDTKLSQVSINGSGDLKLNVANASSARFVIAGSGDIRTKLSNCSSVTCLVNGSGDVSADLNDCGYVTCQTNGSGDITLRGTAKELRQSANGSGDIHSSGLKTGSTTKKNGGNGPRKM